MEGNLGFKLILLDNLKKHKNNSTVMISLSIQAKVDNTYGKSKKRRKIYCLIVVRKQVLKY